MKKLDIAAMALLVAISGPYLAARIPGMVRGTAEIAA
jgi:hypothetical protein